MSYDIYRYMYVYIFPNYSYIRIMNYEVVYLLIINNYFYKMYHVE